MKKSRPIQDDQELQELEEKLVIYGFVGALAAAYYAGMAQHLNKPINDLKQALKATTPNDKDGKVE